VSAPAPLICEAVSFDGLEGFESDDLEAALDTFRCSAEIIRARSPEQRPARPPIEAEQVPPYPPAEIVN